MPSHFSAAPTFFDFPFSTRYNRYRSINRKGALGLKLLHTSDWHLGKSLYEASLHDEQSHFINQILALLEQEAVDAVVLAGDIYDRPLPPGQSVQLYDFFLSETVKKRGIPVIAIAGNHDSASRLEFGASLYRESGYYIYGYPKRDIEPVTLTDRWGEVRFHPIPYLHPADARVLLEDSDIRTWQQAYDALLAHNRPGLDLSVRNVALAHGFFSDLSGREDVEQITSDSEVNTGGMDIADAACFAPFDYTALGHLHAPQWTVRGKVRYSGTPLKYSLSEEHQTKSVTVVELGEKGRVDCRIVPLPPRRDVRVIEGAFDQLSDPAFHTAGSFDDYVFARIHGDTVTYPMEKLRLLFPRILGLAFVDGLAAQTDIAAAVKPRETTSMEELFLRFYRDIKGEDIPPDRLECLREAMAELEGEERDT
ncbi:exonuclease SbcCD subunit D [Ruminococcaceae bacterium OttesenSCG-928-L11]|nr:exonuclease SbcCD subunit D [Ruminococcaceae bacterium OttesenSCG-928-L11]